jgi:ankyrin repeat protein
MAEPFHSAEPRDELSQSFVAAVNAKKSDVVDQLLAKHENLRRHVDENWFAFDSPAIVAAKDSAAMIRVLLKHGADINKRSSWWAGSFGVLDGQSPEMAQFLIERGAKFDIHSAAEQGKLDLVEELVARDPESVNARGGDGQTPLHVAATNQIVDWLLDHGADPTIRCLDHSATAAQYAVSSPEKCRHLILRGSTPDIFMACALGDRELVERVLQVEPEAAASRIGSCPHTRPVDIRSHLHIYFWKLLSASTPLQVAREFDHPQIYEELFRRSPPKQQFLAACWDGSPDRAQTVVSQNPSVMDQLNEWERQALARAAWQGRLESVRVMLQFGFDPHLPGDENSTPLDRAAFHGHREIVELLLEMDPEPPLEIRNQYGGTPLSCCAYGSVHGWKRNTDHLGTAQALIDAGAQIDPSWLPIQNPELDRLFRERLK